MLRDFGGTVESPYSLLPRFGIPVFVANAVGRSVKSPAFYTAMADDRNFGQLDIAQIRDGVEHLIDQGVAHPGRIGITGCSYGGYFTLQSMRTYPGFYAAGNAQCSLTDLFEEFTFGYTPILGYLEGVSPMGDADEYRRDSPYHGAGDITSPLLIFHGTADFLPVQLLTNVHDELDARGVDVTFLRMAGEGHGYRQAESQDYARQLQLQFFRETLVEPDLPPPDRGGTIYLPSAGNGALR
jgi:dipeptidyl aminopeptidase/acylaminoacyl peptidase